MRTLTISYIIPHPFEGDEIGFINNKSGKQSSKVIKEHNYFVGQEVTVSEIYNPISPKNIHQISSLTYRLRFGPYSTRPLAWFLTHRPDYIQIMLNKRKFIFSDRLKMILEQCLAD